MPNRTVDRLIDRVGWEPGPWDDEPDRAEWVDETTGYPCLVKRNQFGVWCGYVAVPPGHPLHGGGAETPDVSVHGGLTYAAPCQAHGPDDADLAICHVPDPGQPDDVWWFGFDCGHCFDYQPGMAARIPDQYLFQDCTYRPLSYARAECAGLAAQLGTHASARVIT